MNIKSWWNNMDKQKLKYVQKNLSQCTMSTNLTWAGFRLNPASAV